MNQNVTETSDVIRTQDKNQPQTDPYLADIARAEAACLVDNCSEGWKTITDSGLLDDNEALAQLSDGAIEKAGWVFTRYIKAVNGKISALETRRLFAQYIRIVPRRPRLYHSMVLREAMNLAKVSPQFNFYRFFKAWNPALLDASDYNPRISNGTTYPAPAALAVTLAAMWPEAGGLPQALKMVDVSRLDPVDLLKVSRRRFVDRMYRLAGASDYASMARLFDDYRRMLCRPFDSRHHSMMLRLALKHPKALDDRRFIDFFRAWIVGGFRPEDWQSEKGKDGKAYPGVAESALTRIFDITKAAITSGRPEAKTLATEFLHLFAEGAQHETDGYWMRYRYAKMLMLNRRHAEARTPLLAVSRPLGRQWYYWVDLANCTDDLKQKTGMLCRAVMMCRNKNFSAPAHLDLAEALVVQGKKAAAALEMRIAAEIRRQTNSNKGRRLEKLERELADVMPADDNSELYRLASADVRL